MTPAPEPRPIRLFVGVAVGTYDSYEALPRAVPDVEAVCGVLTSLSYEGRVIPDPRREDVIPLLEEALPNDSLLQGGSLILMWAGHGDRTPEGRLRLIARNSPRSGAPDLTPELLAGMAARTGASQILLILDTCYSGGGALPALEVAEAVLAAWPAHAERVWFGVVTSAQALERARDGIFAERLSKLLQKGPSTPELMLRWSAHNAGVRGDDLVDALIKEWDAEQEPVFVQQGNAWTMLPNPHFDPQALAQVIEHLLLAARGIDPEEEGFYFTGRVTPLACIVAWLQARQPGILVVTGPAGSGKSAVVGRIVSLSNPAERALLLSHGPLEHADPGEGSVQAHVHARGLTGEQVVQAIDEQLVRIGLLPSNPSGPRNRGDLLGDIERSRSRPLIVVDGLDEAGHGAWQIADDILRLLAPVSRVLIGTREVAAPDGGASLIQRLAPTEVVDLGEEALREATREDLHGYVAKRLAAAGPPAMDPAEIARAILRLASEEDEGIFLLARVITAQLRAEPIDTETAGWETQLSRTLADAFDRDLARIPPLRRHDVELPQAALEVLATLTWGKGAGLPDDLWAIAATALSPASTIYTRDDIYWLLGLAGRYVVEAGEGGRSVYRLSHQRLAEHLQSRFAEPEDAVKETKATTLAKALIDHYLVLLEAGEPPTATTYLWRYAWLHGAESGAPGIELVRRLADRDAPAFLPGLGRALDYLGASYSEVGHRQEALVPSQEAVEIYRALSAANPAFLPNLAGALNNLGNRYGEVGKRQEAFASTQEAVAIYRGLAATNPAFLPNLAGTLNNLGGRYSELGRRWEAFPLTEEAAAIYRDLAATNPAFLPNLAGTLNNLGTRYGELGRRQEAFASTQEAVAIYRDLATTNPAFLPDLASALNNLGGRYSEVGRREEAFAPTEEALVIGRELAATNRRFLPDLASTLTNLGNRHSELGRRQEAFAPTEEAVAIYRDLAATNPGFLLDLARALNNLGIRHSELGHRQEALASTQEAVAIYSNLDADEPAFLPHFAMALTNLGASYGQLGRRQEALAPSAEAVQIYHDLSASNPAFLPDLAAALNSLGNRYGELSRRQEAFASTQQAVALVRDLAATNPAFLPDLASALNNLGGRYNQLGCRQEAFACTQEAVVLYRNLAAANPAFLPDLASALNNLAGHHDELGQEALASTQEAVAIWRDLAATNPAFLPDLARALNNLGTGHAVLGRHEEALAPSEEAVAIYRDLAAVNPGLLPRLALALNNLGNTYSECDRRQEALALIEEAVAIYRDLAAANPEFPLGLAKALHNLDRRYREVGDAVSAEEAWRLTIEVVGNSAQQAFLRLRQAQTRDPDDRRTVDDLLAALALAPAARRDLLADVHATARQLRGRGASWFDAAWREATGEALPAWLALESEHVKRVEQWLAASPATASRQFFAEHAGELLAESTDLALEEIALGFRHPSEIEGFRQLLAQARADGVDEAYRPLLARDLVIQWMAADLAAKRSLLAERREELLGDGAAVLATLQEQHPDDPNLGVHAALLALARSGQEDSAFAALGDPTHIPELLANLARRDEIAALEALASLGLFVDVPPAVQAVVWFHRAVTLALRSQAELALEALREARRLDSGQVTDWLGLLVELSPKYPEVVVLSQALIAKTSGA